MRERVIASVKLVTEAHPARIAQRSAGAARAGIRRPDLERLGSFFADRYFNAGEPRMERCFGPREDRPLGSTHPRFEGVGPSLRGGETSGESYGATAWLRAHHRARRTLDTPALIAAVGSRPLPVARQRALVRKRISSVMRRWTIPSSQASARPSASRPPDLDHLRVAAQAPLEAQSSTRSGRHAPSRSRTEGRWASA